MNIVSKNDIKELAKIITYYDQDIFDSVVSKVCSGNAKSHITSIFLSHSHVDADIIFPIVVFLHGYGIDVYVDWMDKTLDEVPNAETACKLKQKIKENSKFIFLATNDSLSSKWCNWEIGYGDSFKYIDNIAIFPLLRYNEMWKGQEYLEIYPIIKLKYDNGNLKGLDDFYIEYPTGEKISLKDWIKR